ncbi:hypothetical protein ACRE_031400 [Hapsidospora chrysogenum ATCC 11550]|uniref:Uncharacterized protein n=1 Tax=Hapsidospora chrysogenum (strain ATCC 11550 / CBS 779.69 / DSM 880 / IAM 14645 / JCM 23072 / IMI 49137) TaxID=857340 RepID=A0A086T9G1_HAPC1|nr:hypothetical protein ACRE_031400 [Hapsidospora chrysogenum ATCC 11550]
MDFIKKAVDSAKGSSSDSKGSSSNNNKNKDGTDYVDKGSAREAWDAASKKAGHDFDSKTDEQITDGARAIYEKATGYVSFCQLPNSTQSLAKTDTDSPYSKKVSEKMSN